MSGSYFAAIVALLSSVLVGVGGVIIGEVLLKIRESLLL